MRAEYRACIDAVCSNLIELGGYADLVSCGEELPQEHMTVAERLQASMQLLMTIKEDFGICGGLQFIEDIEFPSLGFQLSSGLLQGDFNAAGKIADMWEDGFYIGAFSNYEYELSRLIKKNLAIVE